MRHGLMCYPQAGAVDGLRGDHVTLAPAFIVNESHIEQIVDRLTAAIDETLAAVRVS
jgi:adenosylmethionine-8-amino-7-oxononanoate aminotransferase